MNKWSLEIHRSNRTIGELFRWVLVGCIATGINWGVYWILQHWLDYNISYVIGFILSLVCNYYLSAKFTFNKKVSVTNGVGFCMAHLTGLLIRLILLNLLVFIGVKKEYAAIPADLIGFPIQFLLVRYAFYFKKKI